MTAERIIAVGLLTGRDLDVLGRQFTRFFAVSRDNAFAELLRQLDLVEKISVNCCAAQVPRRARNRNR